MGYRFELVEFKVLGHLALWVAVRGTKVLDIVGRVDTVAQFVEVVFLMCLSLINILLLSLLYLGDSLLGKVKGKSVVGSDGGLGCF